jgi:translocation and assembly module TamA
MDLLFFAEVERLDEPGYLADTALAGGGFVYRGWENLEVRSALALRTSRVEDAFGEREFQMLLLPTSVTWDTRDVELDPTKGLFVYAEATPFLGSGDLENGAQFKGDARAYLGFGEEKRIVAAGRLQFGSLFGPEIEDAPPDYLFFAGGGGSVRGQPYQSLGTGEIDGTIIGGRSYLALSAEMRAYVRGPIGVVGFVDSGYVGAEEFYDGSGEWMTGAGLGVRYDTGFGPIRVDVGTPVDGGPDDADPVQIYIGIGQAF